MPCLNCDSFGICQQMCVSQQREDFFLAPASKSGDLDMKEDHLLEVGEVESKRKESK